MEATIKVSPAINGRALYGWILKVLDQERLKICKMHKRACNALIMFCLRKQWSKVNEFRMSTMS